jgi:hypothetical protein
MTGSSAPSGSVQAYRGDVVHNVTPSSGGYMGFICTAKGTPGTWKQFGLIT